MSIVREFDRELSCVLWISERKPLIGSWRNGRMTDSTNHGPGATEKLASVTADAGGVIWIVGYIRKSRRLLPVSRWDLVTGATGLLVLRSGV